MTKVSNIKLILVVIASSILGACSDSKTSAEQLRTVVNDLGLTGDPTVGRTLPDIADAKAQLGMKVFFTKAMGLNEDGSGNKVNDAACVTCHHPMLGGGDDLSLPIGVEAEDENLLGPGRFHDSAASDYDGGPTVPRNAPTTFNIALWDQFLFHDGRVESLDKTAGLNGAGSAGIRTPDSASITTADVDAGGNLPTAQARFPVTSPEEMKGHVFPGNNAAVRTQIETDMTAAWATEFNVAFGDTAGVTYARIAEVVGEYERSQVFVDTPFKAFVDGDGSAMSEAASRGALLFFRSAQQGGANCASCHSGDFFTDEQFHVIAMPQIGRGKGDGTGSDDFGRFRETGDAADMYAFRTPSLLNVEVTGPWGHAGGYTSLEAVVRHHLDPAAAVAAYDFTQLDPTIQAFEMQMNTQNAVAQLVANRNAGMPSIENVSLSDAQVSDLVEFLQHLTDPCVKDRACMADWIPDASDTNPDALRLNAVDAGGNFL